MSKSSFPYSEQILQWVWNEQLFETHNLRTQCGKRVHILNQGLLNNSDGPDFKHSKIIINDIEWNGSIELHLTSDGWKLHGHHKDPNYNNVILHVVAEHEPKPVTTKSNCTPFTLNLLPYIHSDLERFLSNIEQSAFLPCAKNIRFISEKAFNQQIEKAHQEYLEKKMEDFLSFYAPDISQSLAWKQALIISIFDGFGISNNRFPMQELARKLLHNDHNSSQELQAQAAQLAFGLDSTLVWNFKGCRPNSHPSKRIETATHFLYFINQTPFEHFLGKNALNLWSTWCKEIAIHKAGHPKILFATVYLPALYLLGNVYQSNKLITAVKTTWNSYQAPIPKVLLSQLKQLEIPISSYQKKLGAIYQLKHYCALKKCSECLVLKKVISS